MVAGLARLRQDVSTQVEQARSDPERRLQSRQEFYRIYGFGDDEFGFGRSEIAFLKWEIERGVLNPPDRPQRPGSAWWRGVNEQLIYDCAVARAAWENGLPKRALTVSERAWLDYLRLPSSRSWWRAHNCSIVAGYFQHRAAAEREERPEQVFLNVILYRLLFAQSLVERQSFLGDLGPVFVEPEGYTVAFMVQSAVLYPDNYPLRQDQLKDLSRKFKPTSDLGLSAPGSDLDAYGLDNNLERFFRLFLDHGLILSQLTTLYRRASRWLGTPELETLVGDGKPIYPARMPPGPWEQAIANIPGLQASIDAWVSRRTPGLLKWAGAIAPPAAESIGGSLSNGLANLTEGVREATSRTLEQLGLGSLPGHGSGSISSGLPPAEAESTVTAPRLRGAASGKRVVVLGGGVAGLSAAHELMERGFAVSVYEKRADVWGGKARSYGKLGSGKNGLADLPAEHGFRFFPGFYTHLPDTMKRIPFGTNPLGVFDNLVSATVNRSAAEGGRFMDFPARAPVNEAEWAESLRILFQNLYELAGGGGGGFFDPEVLFFVTRFLCYMGTCAERRLAEYEKLPWWEFVDAESHSPAYQKMVAEGLTRRLVAMDPRQASTRTIGDIGIQFLQDLFTPGGTSDRLLNGPTNDVWIDPWIAYLRDQGVDLHLDAPLQRLQFDGTRITAATVRVGGADVDVVGDYYVCALPVEVMTRFTPSLAAAAPSLAHLDRLATDVMVGIQFYLRRDVPVVHGHISYTDSAWALSSISQQQFWPGVDLSRYGDGTVRGILSVDISDWHTPGNKVVRKPAYRCANAAEVAQEVWEQLKAHLNRPGKVVLDDADLVDWNLEPDVPLPPPLGATGPESAEPLLINVANSWQYRPRAWTEIANLFLASDYVRTATDLASMEGANEAARLATNAILKASGSAEPPCELWPLKEPAAFAPLREMDKVLFEWGAAPMFAGLPSYKCSTADCFD